MVDKKISDLTTSTVDGESWTEVYKPAAPGQSYRVDLNVLASGGGVTVDQWDIGARLSGGSGALEPVGPLDLTEEPTPAAGDFLVGWAGGALRKFDVGDLPAGAGGITELPDMLEGPGAYSSGQFLRSTAGGWEWGDPSASGGNYSMPEAGAITRTVAQLAVDRGYNPKDFGATGVNNAAHTVQTHWLNTGVFASLAAVNTRFQALGWPVGVEDVAASDTIDWAACQLCCLMAQTEDGGKVFVPAGDYKLNRTLIVGYSKSGAVTVHLEGAGCSVNDSNSATVFHGQTITDRPIIEVAAARQSSLSDFTVIGPLDRTTVTGLAPVDNESSYIASSGAIGGQHPQVGIGVGDFEQPSKPSTNTWGTPGGWWGAGYSKGVTVEDVLVRECVVGFGVKVGCEPIVGDQQNDSHNFTRCEASACCYGFSGGNTQARANIITHGRCQNAREAVTSRRHGGFRGLWKVDGFYAVAVFRVFYEQNHDDSEAHFNIDCESCTRIGSFGHNAGEIWHRSVTVIGGRWRGANNASHMEPAFLVEAHCNVALINFWVDLSAHNDSKSPAAVMNLFVGPTPYCSWRDSTMRFNNTTPSSSRHLWVGQDPDGPALHVARCSMIHSDDTSWHRPGKYVYAGDDGPIPSAFNTSNRLYFLAQATRYADQNYSYSIECPLGRMMPVTITGGNGTTTFTMLAADAAKLRADDVMTFQTAAAASTEGKVYALPMVRVTTPGTTTTYVRMFSDSEYGSNPSTSWVLMPMFSPAVRCRGDVSGAGDTTIARNGSTSVDFTTVFNVGDFVTLYDDGAGLESLNPYVRVTAVTSSQITITSPGASRAATNAIIGGPIRLRRPDGTILGS